MTIIFSAVIGIFSVSLLPNLPGISPFLLLISSAAMALMACWFFTSKCRHFFRRLATVFISFLLGFSYSYAKAVLLLDQQLAIDLDNKTFVVDGVVKSLIKKSPSSMRFDIAVEHLYKLNKDKSLLAINNNAYKNIRLSYYLNDKDTQAMINTGDHWRFTVKLKRPRGFVNPDGFDYQAYLLAEGLSATGYIKNNQSNKKIANYCTQYFSVAVGINCLRADLNHFIDKHFHHSTVLGVLKGLLTGDKQSMTKSQWGTLQNTGTIHLLAISGLHIGLAASIGFLLGKFFRRLFQIAKQNNIFFFFNKIHVDHYLPSTLSILFALLYSLLAGLSLPTQRALIMLGIFHIGLLFYRKSRPWFLLSMALFFTAILDPLACYQQGFWLSFIAVATLILVFNGYTSYKTPVNKIPMRLIFIHKSYQFLSGFSKAQWAVSIGLLLPSLLLLKGVSGLGFIANFIAIPLVSLITVPLILLGFLLSVVIAPAALVFFSLAEKSLLLLFSLLEYIERSGIQFWSLSLADKSILSLSIAAVGICYLLLPRGLPAKWLACFCVVPLLLTQKQSTALKLTIFDVGQGTAIILETANHTFIYDAGRHYSDSFDVGEHILSPYLLQRRKSNVDILMVSHNDGDHAGGVGGLLKKLNIRNIYGGELNREDIAAKQCQAGQQWQWDSIHFTVVWPTASFISRTRDSLLFKSNNLSCVLLITYKSYSILLTGDIEASIEKQLITSTLIPKGITVLLAPHHGSKTSSHSNWVNYLQPENVVFSAGYKNHYRHPHPDVVKSYQRSGARIFNTATDGAISFTVKDGGNAAITKSRHSQKRYWYD